MNNILTYVELKDSAPVKLSLETLSKASEIAKENSKESIALLLEKISDDEIKNLQNAGADKIVIVERESYNMEEYSNVIFEISKKYEIEDVFIPGTLDGKDIAANVAAKFETVSVTNVMDIQVENDGIKYTTPAYGATVLNISTIKKAPRIITTRSGAFNKREDLNGKGEVVEENIEKLTDLKAIIRDIVTSNEAEINLEDAPIIIACGRGASSDEIFPLVKELADAFDAPISGTRPVIDDGVLPKNSQIGQSGKIVSPKLYIGCGVSGAVQHVSGIENSDFIIAINKDEDAPIFNIADIGIVGDCAKILPLFIEEVKKIRNN